MKRHACVIAGALALDDLPDAPDTLGGQGFYAAAAAAPLAVSQLWCRAGELDNSIRRVITARHIDEAGIDYAGSINRWSAADGWRSDGPLLGSLEPVSASDLSCALVIGLPAGEMDQALNTLHNLGDQVGSTLLVAPRLADCLADDGLLDRCCQRAGVLIFNLAAAQTLSGEQDPLAAARHFQERGAKSVVLSAGALGGLVCYQQKCCTWASHPVTPRCAIGISATFAGALTGALAEAGKCDWRSLKRSIAIASAVAGASGGGIGPKKMLGFNRSDYTDLFNRLRRNTKY